MEYTIYVDDYVRRVYTIEADSVEEALDWCLQSPYETCDSELEVASIWDTAKLENLDNTGLIYARTEKTADGDRIFL